MSPQKPNADWLPLGKELKKLRTMKGLSTRDVAGGTSLSNARASRIETGLSIMTVPELDEWAATVGVTEDELKRLYRLTEHAYSPSSEDFEPEQGDDFEREYARVEATATRLVTISRIIPGLLQTADYMAAVMRLADETGTRDIAVSVAVRTERASALFKGDKTYEFIISESDLRIPVGGPGMMAAQYDRIAQLSRLDGVKIGILPIGGKPTALLMSDASLLLNRLDGEPDRVYIEMQHGGVWINRPENVAKYVAHANRLWAGALVEGDARDLLARLAAEGN